MENVEALDPGAGFGSGSFVVRVGRALDRADREEIGKNDFAGHLHRRRRSGCRVNVDESILVSTTTEVTSFYILESGDPSNLRRLGHGLLNVERHPVLFKVKVFLAIEVLGGFQQWSLCSWNRTTTNT